MSAQLAKKLLVVAIGVLFLLVALLYQLRHDSQPQKSTDANRQDITKLLRNSLIQQRRFFQRCWLQGSLSQDQQVWQLYLTVNNKGRVQNFELLNKAMFDAETEKCLRDISMRLKFPAFDGDEISFSIPIRISTVSGNR